MSSASRMTGLGVPPTWSTTPWFLTTPPEVHAATIERPRLVATIEAAARAHSIVAVGAPSGYGKSTVVAQWARSTSLPTAWLSLTRFDADPRRLTSGIIAALRSVIDIDPLTAASIDDLRDHSLVVDHIADRVAGRAEPIVLVVDQVEHVEDLAATVLGALAQLQPMGLRLIVVGTANPADLLSALGRPLGTARIGAGDLALTRDEVRAAAALLPIGPIDARTAGEIMARTEGWAIAVRLTLLSRAVPLDRDLADYVEDAILARLPGELSDFVRAAVTAARLDQRLAVALSGHADAGALLGECVRRGLFLDRFTRDGARVYAWHAAFRDAVLAAEHERDPTAFRARHAAAGDALRSRAPLEAIHHFFEADDPDAVYDVILASWIELVQEGHSRGLDAACAALPASHTDRPALLNIRACCAWLASNPAQAYALAARAVGRADATPREAAVSALASILVNDDPDLMRAGVTQAREIARQPGLLSGRSLAYALYVTGYAELRLREAPTRVFATLSAALRECESQGLTRMAARVAATLGYACAFAGRFTEALEFVERSTAHDPRDDEWQVYDAGAASVARGFVAYWRDDLAAARSALGPIVATGHGREAYGPVALVYNALAAAASGDRTWQLQALELMKDMPNTTILGVPWQGFRACALSELSAALGRMSDAVAHTAVAIATPGAPVPYAMAAEMLRRAGRPEAARRIVAHANMAELPAHAQVVLLVTDALLRSEAGRPDAHLVLERALALAVPERILRPFVASAPEIGRLLEQHRARGTDHDAFVSLCLSRRARSARGGEFGLSKREREILSYLRSPMTLPEIAATLFVSTNTVKTHVRVIYRKLGVHSRAEAVRVPV